MDAPVCVRVPCARLLAHAVMHVCHCMHEVRYYGVVIHVHSIFERQIKMTRVYICAVVVDANDVRPTNRLTMSDDDDRRWMTKLI